MRRLARDILLMALATGVSRLLGLARMGAIANRFGASAAYDAFLIAFFLPNLLRGLLAEGALSTAFVPIYTGLHVRPDGGSRERPADAFAGNLLSWLLVLFPITVALGVLTAPLYVPFLASGFGTEKLSLAISLTQWIFPFVALMGFAAIFMGILNAHRRFFAASFAPVWFNVGMLVGVLGLAHAFPDAPIYGLAAGVLLGGAGQLASQIPALRRVGFRFHLHLFPVAPAIRTLARRMAPAVLALAVTQVNLLVDNKIASYLPDGGISALQYAMRLFQLPLGMFAVSIGTALLPRLSSAHTRSDDASFSRDLGDGLTLSGLVLLPAMAGLLILGTDVVRLLFEHGSFGPAETARTAGPLLAYTIGLLPYGLVFVLTRASHALGRTVVPVLASILAVGVNVGLDLALVGPLQETGLALATATAGWVSAGLLVLFLRRQVAWDRAFGRHTLPILGGTLLMAAIVFGLRALLGSAHAALVVFVPTGCGVAVLAGITRLTSLWGLVRGFGGAERGSRSDGESAST